MNKLKLKILVVDDSSVMRKVVCDAVSSLPNYDITVYEAPNGMEAEEILQMNWIEANPIHIVLCDWMMPEMSGVQFLEKLRSVEHFKNVPVIMLTAETYQSQMARCLELGVFSYIIKPFTKAEVLDVLGLCVQQKVYNNELNKKAS